MFKKTITFIRNYYFLFILSIILWCVLNESITAIILIEGFIVALLTCILLQLLLGSDNHYAKHESFSILIMIKYVFVLLVSIYQSTFTTIKIIFTDYPTPKFVKIEPNIKDPWARSLIANSITLTPGTITAEDNGKTMTVLWIKPSTTDKSRYTQIIQGNFEKIFSQVDR